MPWGGPAVSMVERVTREWDVHLWDRLQYVHFLAAAEGVLFYQLRDDE